MLFSDWIIEVYLLETAENDKIYNKFLSSF